MDRSGEPTAVSGRVFKAKPYQATANGALWGRANAHAGTPKRLESRPPFGKTPFALCSCNKVPTSQFMSEGVLI